MQDGALQCPLAYIVLPIPTGAATITGPAYLAGGAYYLVPSPGYSYVPAKLLYQ